MARRAAETLDVPRGPLWFKVTGMLNQNWAMVVDRHANVSLLSEPLTETGATLLFFDDHGGVFDVLTYANAAQAEHALAFNGFTPLNDQPGFRAVADLPTFPLTRQPEETRPVYSSGEYWRQPPGIERVTQRWHTRPEGLERFLQAQTPVIETVMEELRAGRKETRWMWFVFPQLHECFRLVLQHRGRKAEDIFGTVDAMKLRSCATLFKQASATPHSVFQLALQVFFGGRADPETLRLL